MSAKNGSTLIIGLVFLSCACSTSSSAAALGAQYFNTTKDSDSDSDKGGGGGSGGFMGGFMAGLTDPIGSLEALFSDDGGSNLTEVDPNSDTGIWFDNFKDTRCAQCAQTQFGGNCKEKGFTLENCRERLA